MYEKTPSPNMERQVCELDLLNKKSKVFHLKKRRRLSRLEELFNYGLSVFPLSAVGYIAYKSYEAMTAQPPKEIDDLNGKIAVSILLLSVGILNGIFTYKKNTKRTRGYSTQINTLEKEIEELQR